MDFNQILFILFIASGAFLLFDFIFIAIKRSRKAPFIVFLEYIFIFSGLIYFLRIENFEFVLTLATIASGLFYLLDKLIFSRLRLYRYHKIKESRPMLQPEEEAYLTQALPLLIDYALSFFWVLLLVFVLRSFFFEPFRIPTGSLVPTLLPGDFIVVNKFDYGLRLPVINKKLVSIHEPKRGDIVVFRYPVNPKIDFIKRVVGLPGDTLSYVNKVLYINGQEASQIFEKTETYLHESGNSIEATRLKENLLGLNHDIYQFPSRASEDFTNLTVPQGMYFMMGDNRDDSADSRYWGFVPENYIVGKPYYVLFNWDSQDYHFRWERMGLAVQAMNENQGS